MSRHGYSEDYDELFPNALELYRRRVENAINGKRGQAFLRTLADAMDRMPVKELGSGGLVDDLSGKACTLGVVALERGADPETLMSVAADQHNAYASKLLNVAECMAAEIAYENDEGGRYDETPAQRWQRMRCWVRESINAPRGPGHAGEEVGRG